MTVNEASISTHPSDNGDDDDDDDDDDDEDDVDDVVAGVVVELS